MIKIEWKNKATKQFLKLPQKQQIQIADGVDVLFNFQKIIQIISIEEIKKRDDNTY